MSVRGKVILITGAASGIGAACARKLAKEGSKVVLNDINAAAGKTIADELTVAGKMALFFPRCCKGKRLAECNRRDRGAIWAAGCVGQ